MNPFFRKFSEVRLWERLLRERLSEPIHMTVLSLLAGAFGNFETKVYFDLIVRPHHAFCLLEAARFAKHRGYRSFTALEFGVANGAGLMNMASIAGRVTRATGIEINLVGFDSGAGMPPPVDYRDHPDWYQLGDFPMQDYDRLHSLLPPTAKLVLGDIGDTLNSFLTTLDPKSPVGYVALDVDYYSSSMQCLKVFDGAPENYLPEVLMYLDDVSSSVHNPYQGEYLAVSDFNVTHAMRKICPFNFLRNGRLFKKASWIDQIYLLHVLDHASKAAPTIRPSVIMGNPYLNLPTVG